MIESLIQNHEKEHSLRKFTLEQRANTPEKAVKLFELYRRAEDIEEKLYTAYGSNPSEGQRLDALEGMREDLLALARDATALSDQYRKFNVGAVLLGLQFPKVQGDNQNPWRVLFDANTKPTENDKKWCAEQYLMDRATGKNEIKRVREEKIGDEIREIDIDEQLDEMLGFFVVGKPQTDDDSKKEQITLTPCKPCRDRIFDLASPETEVVTANIRNIAFRKMQRAKDLHAFHGERDYIDLD